MSTRVIQVDDADTVAEAASKAKGWDVLQVVLPGSPLKLGERVVLRAGDQEYHGVVVNAALQSVRVERRA